MLDRHADRRIAAVRVTGDVGLRDFQVPQYRGDVIAVPSWLIGVLRSAVWPWPSSSMAIT